MTSHTPTILAALEPLATQEPARPAITADDFGALTLATVLALVRDARAQLAAFGIRPGVRLAVLHGGGATAGLLTQLAGMVSATSIPLNPALTDGELEQQIRGTGAAVLLTDQPARLTALSQKLALPLLRISLAPAMALDLAFVEREPREPFSVSGDPGVALILHTSGSTGTPKAVPLSDANLLASAHNVARSLALGPGDTGLNLLPQFHVGALVDLLLAPLLAGGGIVVGGPFDARQCLQLIERYPVTWLQGVPTMLRDLLDHAAHEHLPLPRQLRFIRSVSAPLPVRLSEELEAAFKAPVIEMYGMSESSGLIASNPLPPEPRKPGSVGRTHGAELRVVTGTGAPAQTGERGDIQVRGPAVMNGYLGSSGAEFCDGWLLTGDQGYIDDDGFVFLRGRSKETINRGGEKISPLDLDQAAAGCAGVADAAGFAVPHATLGEEAALAVVPEPGVTLEPQALQAQLRSRVAAFKVPRHIFVIDALPRTAGGKLQRHQLRELCADDDTQAVSQRPLDQAERSLAAVWEDVLGVPVADPDANFFDLGGDSLKAIWLIEELGVPGLTGADLYLHPTVAELNQRLRQPSAEPSDSSPETRGENDALSAALVTTVRAYLQGWHGSKRADDALLTGRHVDVNATPLFWCMNAAAEFDALAAALGPERPLYGMRTLYQVPDRHPRHVPLLADRYLDEVLAIQPCGPYLLGGFCEGAKFALHMAQRLQARGEEVALLAMQEQFVPEPYTGPVAFYVCPDRVHGWARYFVAPEHAWRATYSGPLRIVEMNHGHDDSYQPGHVEQFAAHLSRDIQDALTTGLTPTGPALSMQSLAADAMRAELTVSGGLVVRAGKPATLTVRVRNIGSETWQASDQSRILLGCRWLKRDLTPRHDLAGHAELPRALKPGASTRLQLSFIAPEKLSWRRMQVDLFQDGVGWFADAGSDLLIRRMLIC